jgi:hypothetical protein
MSRINSNYEIGLYFAEHYRKQFERALSSIDTLCADRDRMKATLENIRAEVDRLNRLLGNDQCHMPKRLRARR